MLLLISSLSMIKKKEKWNRTSRDSLIPCNIYIYTYIYYIYLVYYSILRPLLLTILASLPASLVFNLLSFGIYSTQCLYRNYFLFNPFSLNFYYYFLSVLHHAARVPCDRCDVTPIAISRWSVTLMLISTFSFFPSDTLKQSVPSFGRMPLAKFLPSLHHWSSANRCGINFPTIRDVSSLAESTRVTPSTRVLLKDHVDVSRFYYGEHRKKSCHTTHDSLSSSSCLLSLNLHLPRLPFPHPHGFSRALVATFLRHGGDVSGYY